MYDDVVDVAKPGYRLVVTGVFRTTPVRVNPRQRTLKRSFKTYIDVVHVKIIVSGSLGVDRTTRPFGVTVFLGLVVLGIIGKMVFIDRLTWSKS